MFTFVGDTEPVFLPSSGRPCAASSASSRSTAAASTGRSSCCAAPRSGLAPTRNLVGYRYALRPHTDLLEAITFFGASRKWNLDFTCKAFGVASPKEQGMDGYAVGHYYRSGRLREIANYCRRDVEATAGLFRKLEKTLLPALEPR